MNNAALLHRAFAIATALEQGHSVTISTGHEVTMSSELTLCVKGTSYDSVTKETTAVLLPLWGDQWEWLLSIARDMSEYDYKVLMGNKALTDINRSRKTY